MGFPSPPAPAALSRTPPAQHPPKISSPSRSSAMAVTEARPRPVAAARLNGDTMRLIPQHQDGQVRPPRVPLADGTWRVVRTRRPGREPERPAALGGPRAPRGSRRRLAASRRLRAPSCRAGLPGHHGRGIGERERHDSAPPSGARPPNPPRNHPSPSPRRTPKGPLAEGPSPRVRGSPGRAVAPRAPHGSIPACAGKPAAPSPSPTPAWVHPRVCGEAIVWFSADQVLARGSIPRVRGSLRVSLGSDLGLGSIPACAGEAPPIGSEPSM